MRMHRKLFGSVLATALALHVGACDGLMEVTNPDVVDASTVDPEADAAAFAQSAFQNMAEAYGGIIVYSAWFTNEARVGDTFPTRNEFGRRLVDDRNGTHNNEIWIPLARAMASAEDVLEILEGQSNVNVARAALTAGYTALLMAETFCTGTIRVGPELSTAQMIEHAVTRLEQAVDAGAAAGTDAGAAIADAARVGLARAYLFSGNGAQAASVAVSVADDFEFDVVYVDDASARGRLGNNVHFFSNARESLVVGPEWRAIADGGDERISYVDGDRNAQDGVHRFYIQQKFPSYADPIRLASGLEARYIEAEASGDINERLDLINERRTANGLGAFSSADADAVLTELLEQKGRDFWLEGRRMGDWRRNPDHVNYIIQPGDNYYKPEVGTVGTQTCWPLPAAEKDNNPNIG